MITLTAFRTNTSTTKTSMCCSSTGQKATFSPTDRQWSTRELSAQWLPFRFRRSARRRTPLLPLSTSSATRWARTLLAMPESSWEMEFWAESPVSTLPVPSSKAFSQQPDCGTLMPSLLTPSTLMVAHC